MRRETHRSARRKGVWLAGVIGLALLAGAAWAYESQTVGTPSGDQFTVVATLIPGTGDDPSYSGTKVEAMGGMETQEFNIGFDDDTSIVYVNGEQGSSYDPSHRHTVTVVCALVNGTWRANTTVVDDDTGQTLATQNGHVMSQKPSTVTATAEDVISLTAQ